MLCLVQGAAGGVRAGEMRKRRFAQVSTSDEEEEEEPRLAGDKERGSPKKPRGRGSEDVESRRGRRGKADEEEGREAGDGGVQEDAKPVGDVVKVSGKGRKRKRHYAAFEYDGLQFELVRSWFYSSSAYGLRCF